MNDYRPAQRGLRRPSEDPAYQALCEGDTQAFQELAASRDLIDFSYCDLGGVDLRQADIKRFVLTGARLKGADLRGLDLSGHDLSGVTLNDARVSGTLFPADLSADELRLSIRQGTRLRHQTS